MLIKKKQRANEKGSLKLGLLAKRKKNFKKGLEGGGTPRMLRRSVEAKKTRRKSKDPR